MSSLERGEGSKGQEKPLKSADIPSIGIEQTHCESIPFIPPNPQTIVNLITPSHRSAIRSPTSIVPPPTPAPESMSSGLETSDASSSSTSKKVKILEPTARENESEEDESEATTAPSVISENNGASAAAATPVPSASTTPTVPLAPKQIASVAVGTISVAPTVLPSTAAANATVDAALEQKKIKEERKKEREKKKEEEMLKKFKAEQEAKQKAAAKSKCGRWIKHNLKVRFIFGYPLSSINLRLVKVATSSFIEAMIVLKRGTWPGVSSSRSMLIPKRNDRPCFVKLKLCSV